MENRFEFSIGDTTGDDEHENDGAENTYGTATVSTRVGTYLLLI